MSKSLYQLYIVSVVLFQLSFGKSSDYKNKLETTAKILHHYRQFSSRPRIIPGVVEDQQNTLTAFAVLRKKRFGSFSSIATLELKKSISKYSESLMKGRTSSKRAGLGYFGHPLHNLLPQIAPPAHGHVDLSLGDIRKRQASSILKKRASDFHSKHSSGGNTFDLGYFKPPNPSGKPNISVKEEDHTVVLVLRQYVLHMLKYVALTVFLFLTLMFRTFTRVLRLNCSDSRPDAETMIFEAR